MGTLGWPEMMFIFVLALLLFGPKKLPELGRTLGKAMTEFRRASSELKATFDREMRSLEQDTELKELKQITSDYQYDTQNYDYSSYETNSGHEGGYEGSYGETYDSTATTPSTASASATEGAESPSVVEPAGETAAVHEPGADAHAEHTVPRGEFEPVPQDSHHESAAVTPDHKA